MSTIYNLLWNTHTFKRVASRQYCISPESVSYQSCSKIYTGRNGKKQVLKRNEISHWGTTILFRTQIGKKKNHSVVCRRSLLLRFRLAILIHNSAHIRFVSFRFCFLPSLRARIHTPLMDQYNQWRTTVGMFLDFLTAYNEEQGQFSLSLHLANAT